MVHAKLSGEIKLRFSLPSKHGLQLPHFTWPPLNDHCRWETMHQRLNYKSEMDGNMLIFFFHFYQLNNYCALNRIIKYDNASKSRYELIIKSLVYHINWRSYIKVAGIIDRKHRGECSTLLSLHSGRNRSPPALYQFIVSQSCSAIRLPFDNVIKANTVSISRLLKLSWTLCL